MVNRYAFTEEDENPDVGQIEMPVAYRDSQSGDAIWFDFYNREGDRLTPEDAANMDRPAGAIVDTILGDEKNALPVVTFTTLPPNVIGHDGAPLGTYEIKSVIGDLERYDAAVQAGNLKYPAGEPLTGDWLGMQG